MFCVLLVLHFNWQVFKNFPAGRFFIPLRMSMFSTISCLYLLVVYLSMLNQNCNNNCWHFSTPETQNPSENFNPYCANFFGNQLIVGTGMANPTEMSAWSSITSDIVPGSTYVSFLVYPKISFRRYSTSYCWSIELLEYDTIERVEKYQPSSGPVVCSTVTLGKNLLFHGYTKVENLGDPYQNRGRLHLVLPPILVLKISPIVNIRFHLPEWLLHCFP